MTFKYLLAGAAMAAGLAGAVAANASVVVGTEDAVKGFTGNFLESVFPGTKYLVASDGEVVFRPFGATFDVSDGLDFSGVPFVWDQAADSHWTALTAKQTWVLPATTTCGSENEPKCEFVGHFISPSAWNPSAIGTWLILNPAGKVSDKIVTFNSAVGAELKFYSDPFSVPEASTWTLMLMGFGGLGAVLRRRRETATAAA
ncbi:PEP-CTERM sorting domain-containing protein [Phenylobacterium sp.]|uniref:PEP-CTERM sorting domain-containing protein n=1 Tax=Phenylobacterium sp. TaxID=1871053 RepID=UPI00286B3B50|nr:PEP-CTERM sorting domain-containing protein [Phenylobacterium sp.]